jgi:hypothetical protein
MDDRSADFVYGYKGKFSPVCPEGMDTHEVDVEFYCDCGNSIQMYLEEAMMRCKTCGKVYRSRVLLEVGDEIVPPGDPVIYISKFK